MQHDLLENINQQFGLTIPVITGRDELEKILCSRINFLIINNFNWLVQALYRIDINEKKLERLLTDHANHDAANIIAAMVIDRQLEKIKSRQQKRRDINNIDDEERW